MLNLTRIVLSLAFLIASGLSLAGSIDLNKANAETIAEALDGVGLSKAEAIVQYRKQHGSFTSLSELEQVKGIGKKTIERNKDRIALNPGSSK